MVANKKIITSQEIGKLFGLNSQFYQDTLAYLKDEIDSQKDLYNEKYSKWKNLFHKFYGNDTSSKLFLKHTYFAFLLQLFVEIKLPTYNNNSIPEFSIYNWTVLNSNLINKFKSIISNSPLMNEDLFQLIYQQIFILLTRHKIGEFYTFPNLAKRMVDNFYIFGSKILDPTCGSGTFLVEIIKTILKSEKRNESKIRAITNVYGFDVNPLAVLATKVNLALLIKDITDSSLIKILNAMIYLIDSLFPKDFNFNSFFNLKKHVSSFDLVIGNPPWLTYKDIHDKQYQTKVRNLSDKLGIKPPSQYITHIELASVFFYAIPNLFLKTEGSIFFVITKSVLTGDHCIKFRLFKIFNDLEIWDFPKNYVFNVNHICLKAKFIGWNNQDSIFDKYPIKASLFDSDFQHAEETFYNSFNINEDGVKIILPQQKLKFLNEMNNSDYKSKFFQGATLVPRTLTFFEISNKNNDTLVITSDPDILTRSKKNWKFEFTNREIELEFRFRTFLNIDLIPFYLKKKRNVFLPITRDLEFDIDYLKSFSKAYTFYNEMNQVFRTKKKESSKIDSLISNLNYWNKISKQVKNKKFIVVYNASGSKLKATVLINIKKNLVIGSDNYYYSTNSQNEAYYLSAILNTPELSRNIGIIKSSRHIHKRPFSFPIPIFDEKNEDHMILAKKGKKYHYIVQDLVLNNPKITSEKVRTIINTKLAKLDDIFKRIIGS